MNTSKSLLLACVLSSLAAGKLSAQIIDYSITGTFASSAPFTLVSAPNATFDIQFSLPAQQPPNPFTLEFDADFTDASLALNDQTVFSGRSGFAAFGMGGDAPSDTLDVHLTSQNNDVFQFDEGPGQSPFQELFTGSVSNPTLIPASFDFTFAGLVIPVGSTYTDVSVTRAQVAATVAVPEPSSVMMIGIGLFSCAGLAILRNRRRMIAKNNIWIDGNFVAGNQSFFTNKTEAAAAQGF
jgi:hypothetical protein